MFNDFIDNDEILYRRLPTGSDRYEIKNDGTIEIRRSAFFDRGMKISVDRAKLCENNPRHTMGNQVGIIVSLVAGQVRNNTYDFIRNNPTAQVLKRFKIDIEPAPLPSNFAHAQIISIPEFVKADNKTAFKQLTRYLSWLAEKGQWVEFSTNE